MRVVSDDGVVQLPALTRVGELAAHAETIVRALATHPEAARRGDWLRALRAIETARAGEREARA